MTSQVPLNLTLAEVRARTVLEECGLDCPTELPLEDIVLGRGAFFQEETLQGKDGQIITVGDRSVITVRPDLTPVGRRRFTIAHELGHYELHRNLLPVFSDSADSLLQWYQGNTHEREANCFAAEFLMPSELFRAEAQRACGTDRRKIREEGIDLPVVIDALTATFRVSQSAAMLRYVTHGNHPVMAVYCKDNQIAWFKKSDDFPYYLRGVWITPPHETIASEAFLTGSAPPKDRRKQVVPKSAWFFSNGWDNDNEFFEYCVYANKYGYTLSLIWER
ncbi:MAG: ImmA/IrrE family metallo-endopeptidase [Bacteroidetes bacterium]|nr:ImmA/IrrE family metallo-endopeptidase [Bacteroidota bacterium]